MNLKKTRLSIYLTIYITIIGLIIISLFNTILSSIIGFSILGFGISGIIPLSYSLAGKVKWIDSAVGISIISIAVYGVFMFGPVAMGFIAKFFGINHVFSPMIILFFICLFIVILFKEKFNV